ncbi:MAG: hypothetical protein A3F09_04340 [Chlamydiae bacterium RIFCSPHIGHO2_12_FULL_49_11]|nr:MAG: hypothetical protein A3F09_04340 [Chlamydiae bacterium RIFCSPHIGHO2_12_FULL_49_11]
MIAKTFHLTLGDTDATGAIFFPRAFMLAVQLFEEYLFERAGPGGRDWALPVVHAAADFVLPLRHGDLITLELNFLEVKEKSCSYRATFSKGEKRCIELRIVHAATGGVMNSLYLLRTGHDTE